MVRMRSLGFRYAQGRLPGDSFLVDPHLDFRTVLSKQGFEKNLLKRGYLGSFDSLKQNYNRWWNAFVEYSQNETVERKRFLKEQWHGLQSVLQLPNTLKNIDYLTDRRISDGNAIVKTLDPRTPFIAEVALNTFLDGIAGSVRLATPSIVRKAVLEGCHVDLNSFPRIHDSDPECFVVGTSLPSQVSVLIDKEFANKNNFPISFVSLGKGYQIINNRMEELNQVSLLRVGRSISCPIDGFMDLLNHVFGLISSFLPNASIRIVLPTDLLNYEDAAITIIANDITVARVSSIGQFISRRLKIVDTDSFVNLAHGTVYCSFLNKF
uniref:Uncharacterized protein n=1 Tax=Bursaphelenchus xylophilus TaxID=6326 RepID=A0A1I7SDP0_BURXY